MTLRVLYNYILTFLGIRETLPSEIIRAKAIEECNEQMVHLIPDVGLYVKDDAMLCRSSVAVKLKRIARRLHDKGMRLYVYELYRSPEQQEARRLKTCEQLRRQFSDEKELAREVRRSTAGAGGGHQTGGAVDLTLCNTEGVPLDMGSTYPHKCPEMATSHHSSATVMKRRKLLCQAMKEESFVNYPGEWWHYSYGDQLWAAYRYKRHAIYGTVSIDT